MEHKIKLKNGTTITISNVTHRYVCYCNNDMAAIVVNDWELCFVCGLAEILKLLKKHDDLG